MPEVTAYQMQSLPYIPSYSNSQFYIGHNSFPSALSELLVLLHYHTKYNYHTKQSGGLLI